MCGASSPQAPDGSWQLLKLAQDLVQNGECADGFDSPIPGIQALTCQKGTLNSVYNATELPLRWTTGQEDCEEGWGCQDTLMLIHNGPQVNVVITKGCTQAEDQEARVTEHRAGPGLSIISYTHVCRKANLCNDLANSVPLWTPSSTAPEGTQCPTCLSRDECKESGTELPCPAGLRHCYNGILLLNGGGISTSLRVQGCMAQGGCNLLNGTQEIGPIRVREKCNPKGESYTQEKRPCPVLQPWGVTLLLSFAI
ncbi:CD177 antigen-like [Trichechus manatus latirostris]|uniref:CD177 antigen-like n=1 Tax=Trichechus manatus latirostris TaxID=127582 RepID=A0A2Y9E965_TRIMA|nr:CD177 antigen-like [Trichechus manatus latirostris]